MDTNINWTSALQLGDLTIPNRVIMAALTRERCDPNLCIPTPLMQEYYEQRAAAGFILSQATAWSLRGRGFVGAACLYDKEQMEGWRKVVEGVHKKNGRIFVQLIHCGRVAHPSKTGGLEIWAPSAMAVRESIRDMPGVSFPVPKEMTLEEIDETKRDYEQSVLYAKEAGFDGVQLHGAHGYLIHEFLNSSSNKRSDAYGGSPQNRIKFTLELIDLTLKHFPPHRVGIKLSPASRLKDMFDENPIETYSLLLQELDKRQIGFVEFRQSTEFYPFPNLYPLSQRQQIPDVCKAFRPYYKGLIIGNDSFNEVTGLAKMREGNCDAISFGRLYISNPDLAERIVNGWEINSKWDMKTFYGHTLGEKGLTDYPFYKKSEV